MGDDRSEGGFPQPDRSHGTRYYSFVIGQYHTGDDERCYWRVKEAIDLVQDAGGSLERIQTISGRAVASRRRKHRRDEFVIAAVLILVP